MVDYSETIEVKVILSPLSKVTQNETGSQVSDTGPLVLWFIICLISFVGSRSQPIHRG